MGETSKIYNSTEFLFTIGDGKCKTRKQIDRMMDQQSCKKREDDKQPRNGNKHSKSDTQPPKTKKKE
jgi:hypothetical protein